MNQPAVMIEICLAFLKRYLSGFRGYPHSPAGENRFAEALQANAVSVEHLEAILQAFEDEFPTVRQINDVALNLRARYETQPDQRAEWEKQYGKPGSFALYPPDELAMRWQAFRDTLYYTEGPAKDMHSGDYWENAKFNAVRDHPDSLQFVRRQVDHYGWVAVMQMPAAPERMPYKSPNPDANAKRFVPIAARVTQADIDRVEQARKTTQQVDDELDGWDNPDR